MGTNHVQVNGRMADLAPYDLELLLGSAPVKLLGRIIELNGAQRYHNGSDAIVLCYNNLELRNRLTGVPE